MGVVRDFVVAKNDLLLYSSLYVYNTILLCISFKGMQVKNLKVKGLKFCHFQFLEVLMMTKHINIGYLLR